jgi:hypothetical protein
LALALTVYPLSWILGRPLGGDCIYLVAQAPMCGDALPEPEQIGAGDRGSAAEG